MGYSCKEKRRNPFWCENPPTSCVLFTRFAVLAFLILPQRAGFPALAVVVLIHHPGAREEDTAKVAWVTDLKGLGYQRIVFLRGGNGMRVNGLPVLECPQASATFAGK